MLAYVLTVLLLAVIGGLIVLAGKRPSRTLPEPVCKEIEALPERRRNQHVVDLELRDGRVIREVWIAWGKYIALIGGRTRSAGYAAAEVVHARLHVKAG